MSLPPVIQSVKALVALPLRGLVHFVHQFSQWAVSRGREVHEETRPLWKQIRPQSPFLEDPPDERSSDFPLQARWLARVLVASRPLGP